MSLRKAKFYQLLSMILLIFLLSACNKDKPIDNYYLSLTGESPTWDLSGYEIVITPDSFKAGNGILKMKNENEYITKSFQYATHLVMNGKNTVVHSGAVSGEGVRIAERPTGNIEGDTYLNEKGQPITLHDISAIYMIVEWWDTEKNTYQKERIDLYNKDNQKNSFLRQ